MTALSDRTDRAAALARTYGGDRDGWTRVAEYQRVQEYAAAHPNGGSSAVPAPSTYRAVASVPSSIGRDLIRHTPSPLPNATTGSTPNLATAPLRLLAADDPSGRNPVQQSHVFQ